MVLRLENYPRRQQGEATEAQEAVSVEGEWVTANVGAPVKQRHSEVREKRAHFVDDFCPLPLSAAFPVDAGAM